MTVWMAIYNELNDQNKFLLNEIVCAHAITALYYFTYYYLFIFIFVWLNFEAMPIGAFRQCEIASSCLFRWTLEEIAIPNDRILISHHIWFSSQLIRTLQFVDQMCRFTFTHMLLWIDDALTNDFQPIKSDTLSRQWRNLKYTFID